MILTLLEVCLGSVVVLGILPVFLFPRLTVDSPDQWISRTGLMVLWIIVAGYVMAAVNVFSGVLLLVLMVLTGWLLHRRRQSRYVLTHGNQVSAAVYDSLSEGKRWRRGARDWIREKASLKWDWVPREPLAYVWIAAALLIIGASAWMRFDADWHHAGLFFSDAYETVAWVKGIDASTLFPNGIYPQGYYIVMAGIQTLTHANAVTFVKFFGAFVGTLLTASVMWSTFRFSGRAVPALAAGAIYGLLPHLLPYQAVRQMAAEGQEFGNLWVLPVAWLVFQSWVTRKRGYAVAASVLLAVVGLAHPIALLNAALAAIAGTFGGWSVAGISGRVLKSYLWMVPVAAAIVVAPLAIGLELGKPLLSSGLTFLTETIVGSTGGGGGAPSYPPIAPMVWVALGGIFALFVTKLLWYDELWEMGLPATAFLLLLFAEAVVQLPRVGINYYPLVTRSGEFLALVEALSIGLGAAGVQEAVERLGVQRSWAAGGALVVAAGILGFLLKRAVPQPFMAYTMNSDSYVAEFVRLGTSFPNFSWAAVANGGYALAVNQGYQYNPNFWVSHVSPQDRWPHYHAPRVKTYALDQRYIFFFVPSRVYVPNVPGRAYLFAQDAQQLSLLRTWLRDWTRLHGPMPIYFKNRDLTIYWIQNRHNPAL